MALANEGVHVTLTARGAGSAEKDCDDIRKANPGVTVTEVAGRYHHARRGAKPR